MGGLPGLKGGRTEAGWGRSGESVPAWHQSARRITPEKPPPSGVIFNCRCTGMDGLDGGAEEVGGFEDFEVAFGARIAAGSVNDGFGVGVPGDFLEREWGAQ